MLNFIKNNIAFLIVLCFIIFNFNFTIQHNKQKHSTTLMDDSKNIASFSKECSEYQQCTHCNFEEMKTEEACFYTSFYKIKQCNYYDNDGNLKHEEHIKEKCNGSNYSFYLLYIMFFLLVGVGSNYLRRKEKKKLIGNVFDKNKNTSFNFKFK